MNHEAHEGRESAQIASTNKKPTENQQNKNRTKNKNNGERRSATATARPRIWEPASTGVFAVVRLHEAVRVAALVVWQILQLERSAMRERMWRR